MHSEKTALFFDWHLSFAHFFKQVVSICDCQQARKHDEQQTDGSIKDVGSAAGTASIP